MEMDKEQFRKVYFEKTNREVAVIFDISVQTVINYAKKLGFKKGRGNKTKIKFRG